MWEFHTREGVQAFVDAEGIEALRDMVAGTRLAENRRPFVRQWLAGYDRAQQAQAEDRRAAEANEIALRAATASEAQAVEAKRSADAAEVSAKAAVDSAAAAKDSAKHARIAWVIAALSAVTAIAALVIPLISKK
ncbi:hypothetical protein [Paraburkholderia sp. RL17-373-BIF-A]|uniref:hypothetical protein n=1 Tax=Paraburkholderia sp. RL17-373-BIF-A TaxID=3031629 RepID=UPI0038BBF255